MSLPAPLPEAPFVLANARVHASHLAASPAQPDADGFVRADIAIAAGRIARLGPAEPTPDAIDLKGRIVFPGFVDCHTHLDKGHIWTRQPNPDGSFSGALDAVAADCQARWSAEDVAARMDFALRCAYAYGTVALRTHLDSQDPQDAITWPVFAELRDRWAGRIALQGVCLVGIEAVRDLETFGALARRVRDEGGVLGAVAYQLPDLEPLVDTVFATAEAHGLDLDFHADETGDPDANALDVIARTALARRFSGQVNVGHCCSLAHQPDDTARRTLDRVAEAGLSITSLPLCNLYLQDRRADGTTPRWRGVTLVHEMAARGIPVALASDNTRDPFYAYGDLDMLEVYRLGTRILHLDHPVAGWPAAVAATPARIMGIDAGRIAEGASADLVVFAGRSWTELLSRPEAHRTVIRAGRAIDATPPDYAELDSLMEA